jgi:hypothetical protein
MSIGLAKIEDVFSPAPGANRLNLTFDVPVTVTHFDIDATLGIIGRQQNRALLTAALPTVNRSSAATAGTSSDSDAMHRHGSLPLVSR